MDQFWAERHDQVDPEWRLLERFVDPLRAAVDVGAHSGLYAGKLCRLAKVVHCFEPIPELARHLVDALPDNARVYTMALSSTVGEARLRIPVQASTARMALATLESSNALGESACRELQVAVARLDGLIDDPVGFIKIDAEGHELAVLEGSTGLIQRDRPAFLVESEHRHNPSAPQGLFNFFEQLDYQVLFLQGGSLHPVAEFRPDRHQRLTAEGEPERPYVNNFFAVPR